jgi:uncharacterized protein (TIGR02646 family)
LIPFTRQPLTALLTTQMRDKTAVITASPTPTRTARSTWKNASGLRQELKARLATMSARPSFCMYCYESRGTDVDHFEPIARDPLLTFTWSNHLLACGFCNQQAKKEHFPVDAIGHPLLIDPSVDDSADDMTLSSAGDFIELTPRGAATIAVLRLNDRTDLVDARFKSWRHVIRVFTQAVQSGGPLSVTDVEDLRCLPVADAFHHFAHDVKLHRLGAKGVHPRLAAYASECLPTLRDVFPRCDL